jgi:1-acyl-sn-glycerol-3-phosphate acyltransferase
MDTFRNGVSKILESDAVPVIPMALRGLWGSFFSHKGSPALTRMPRRFWSRVELIAGDQVQPMDASPEYLQERVLSLRGDIR